MPAPITPISGIELPTGAPAAGESSGGIGFRDVLSAAIHSVESAGQNAAQSIERFLSGESNEELHTVLLAAQQAELSLDLFLQIRNKAVSAYQEIMRMPM
jgi:flagellar hook-basal body complex protein FliE